jgi:hypothetical protein
VCHICERQDIYTGIWRVIHKRRFQVGVVCMNDRIMLKDVLKK